jgi:hypothetical protein
MPWDGAHVPDRSLGRERDGQRLRSVRGEEPRALALDDKVVWDTAAIAHDEVDGRTRRNEPTRQREREVLRVDANGARPSRRRRRRGGSGERERRRGDGGEDSEKPSGAEHIGRPCT